MIRLQFDIKVPNFITFKKIRFYAFLSIIQYSNMKYRYRYNQTLF